MVRGDGEEGRKTKDRQCGANKCLASLAIEASPLIVEIG